MSEINAKRIGFFLHKYRALVIIFTLCFYYWAYLIIYAEMAISTDAIGYEELGRLVHESGWKEFLRTGPHREPFYPWLVATSMGIADQLSVSYQLVQKWVQVFFLFVSQLLLLFLLNKLKISPPIKWTTVLYFGFSPGLVNAAFSLFSEIATFPFVPLMVLACVWSWQSVLSRSLKHIGGMAVLTVGTFLLAAGTKSAFIYVFLACLIPFVFAALRSLRHKDYRKFLNATAYIVLSFCLFLGTIIGYMSLNQRYNGYFQVNDRNTTAFLGSALKRSNPLTPRMILAHISSIPGNKVCQKFFTEEECRYVDWYGSDTRTEVLGLVNDVPTEKRSSKAFRLAIDKALERPFQYAFFTFVEGAKMPFWESTKIGFVNYPPVLMAIFDNVLFKNGLRLFVAVLTVCSLFFLVFSLYRDRHLLFEHSIEVESIQIRLFSFIVISVFIGLYAVCYVLTRYALPIGSLYLISIAYCIQSITRRS